MANALEAIRARLAAADQSKNRKFDNSTFPFWNVKNGGTSTLRFLPDGNPKNEYFWAEKQQIRLEFPSIKGVVNNTGRPVIVNVPCVEMWGKTEYPHGCPVLNEVRAWYKVPNITEDDKKFANKYWVKRSYITQGFVRSTSISEENAPANPIRKFTLNKQLYNLVEAGIRDPDMKNIPCDYERGTDFRVTKTAKGEYGDYGTSSYARVESALTSAELAAIEQYGLSDLSDFLGKKPTKEDQRIIHDMFEASVQGEEYDESLWGKFYRPVGLKNESDSEGESDGLKTSAQHKTVTPPAAKQEVADTNSNTQTETAETPSTQTGKASTADILNMIKNRGKSGAKA